jgi:predicted phosphodiesterase
MKVNRMLKVDERLRHPFEHLLFKSIGIEHISRVQKLMNNPIKKRSKTKIETAQILITGHTHIAEFDTSTKFVNTGFIDQGIGWYLELDDNGYELIKCTY